jgi:hypothetical protein
VFEIPGQQQAKTDTVDNVSTKRTTIEADAEKTFTLYPKLPLEVKKRVWKFATQNVEPRLVAFGRRGGTIPAVLHACRLSRSGAAPTYTFLKCREHHKEGFNMSINFEVDVVFLRTDSSYGDLRGYFPDSQLEVKRLAVSPESDETLILNLEYEQSGDMLEILWNSFSNLKEFLCIANASSGQVGGYNDPVESVSNYIDDGSYFFNAIQEDVSFLRSILRPPPLELKLTQFR